MISDRWAFDIEYCYCETFNSCTFYKIEFQVTKDRGEKLAVEYGIKFVETSAKASINVEEAFFTLASDIKAKMEKRMVWKKRKFQFQNTNTKCNRNFNFRK